MQQDMNLAGFHIPKDTIIITAQYSFQHNPKYWSDPEKFEPERFLRLSLSETPQWAPFGDGVCNCCRSRRAACRVIMC